MPADVAGAPGALHIHHREVADHTLFQCAILNGAERLCLAGQGARWQTPHQFAKTFVAGLARLSQLAPKVGQLFARQQRRRGGFAISAGRRQAIAAHTILPTFFIHICQKQVIERVQQGAALVQLAKVDVLE
jgi:hypothetical protein